ncbi:hypothetical protein CDD83_7372 [Cordyceps sp. RAO-2017]|nr:hypothetical protein CDD83_7372 [Cordyceps sp. RAO-2017]
MSPPPQTCHGSYNFGYIDTSQYTGDITYTPASSLLGFWQWTSTGYSVGDGAFNPVDIDSVADTGTSIVLLPAPIVRDYWDHVTGGHYDEDQKAYVFPCSSALPDLSFGVENATISIPGEYVRFGHAHSESETCYGGIQNNRGGLSIWGDVALKAAFVVFDVGQTRIGWAQAR